MWVIGENGKPQPVEKHFFDLNTEQANTTGTTSSNSTTPTTSASSGAELTEADKDFLVTEEESVRLEESTNQLAAAEYAIKQKVIEKYKLQIDGIIERLQEKINTVPVEQRSIILKNMQDKVASKKPPVMESTQIDEDRKEILLEILDYIIAGLDPASVPTPPAS